jgi:hypothetical protein
MFIFLFFIIVGIVYIYVCVARNLGKSALIKGSFWDLVAAPSVSYGGQYSNLYSIAFREMYAPRAWEEERLVWRAVIHLDLVRSVNKMLDTLAKAPETPHWTKLPRMRLSPLCRVQRDLEAHLGLAEGEEVHAAAISELAKQRQHHKPDQRSLADREIELIVACRDDMAALWKDDDVRTVLEKHGLRQDEHYQL